MTMLVSISEVNYEEVDEAVKQVGDFLAAHGLTHLLTVGVLHDHFEVGPDEILVETTDPEARTQHIQVGSRSDIRDNQVTLWRFTPQGEKVAMYGCQGMPHN